MTSAQAIQLGRVRTGKPKAKVYTARPEAGSSRLKAILFYGIIFAILFSALAAAAFLYFFTQYNALVLQRVQSGFWQSRGGVYSSEAELKVGQRMTPDALAERLRLSGYIEGPGESDIWNGTFTVDGQTIRVNPSAASGEQGNATIIKFAGDKITDIQARGYTRETFAIEPEMLVGRSQAKRTADRVLAYDAIPADLRNAILAAEDQRFFSHYGIDPRGIARAFKANLTEGQVIQGGSTITQQLAKNTFLSPERSYKRKFEEAFYAVALEHNLTKEQIFALYCNEIYLGQYGSTSVHGVEQAARVYFGKELGELTLAESAAIAGMIKNPNNYGPHKEGDAPKARRDSIVTRMVENGSIDGEQAELARGAKLALREPMKNTVSTAPHFVDTALKSIEGGFGGDYLNANLNMRVYTTLNTQMQRTAQAAVTKYVEKLNAKSGKNAKPLEAALVSMDPHTGRVLAMVGGSDYQKSQFNRAADAMRQPGSTFKPFVYATALERGYSPITTYQDAPQDFVRVGAKNYKPENYGRSYTNKPMTLKTALVRSSNVVAVRTAFDAGIHRVAEKARQFGFSSVQDYPSIALGAMEATPLQLATAYASFANGGIKVDPVLIDRIVSGRGDTLYQSKVSDTRILSEQNAYMITDMLKGVVERGTGRAANDSLGKDVAIAGKTGSSKDGWFVGYTPNLVTVVWVGYDETQDVGSTGGEIALPLWVDFMKAAIRANPELGGSVFEMPAGMTSVVVDPETGMAADSMCPLSERVVLKKSMSPAVKCLMHQPKVESLYAGLDTEAIDEPNVIEVESEQIDIPKPTNDPPSEISVERGVPPSAKRPESSRSRKVGAKEVVVQDTYYSEYLDSVSRGN
jgi:penicillin-binding protein 1B